MNLKAKQKIPLKIKRMGIDGEGIGFYKKTLVFVPGALKGKDIFCQVTAVKHNFAQARLITISKKSKFRVESACPIHRKYGGYQIMHLRYDKQLEFKDDLIAQSLKKFKPAGYENYDIRHTLGMEVPYHYRARLQFRTRSFKGSVKAGPFEEGSHRLVGIRDCLVQDKLTQTIINRVTELLKKHHIPIYDERKIAGVRTVMIRKAVATNQVQLIFIISRDVFLAPVIKQLTARFNMIRRIAVNVNRSKSSEVYDGKTEAIRGNTDISKEVSDYQFSLSPRAFYQLNPQQTEVLYGQAVAVLDISENDHVIDAYYGVGTIGFTFAVKVKSVRDMDIIPETTADAEGNAQRMGFENAHHEVGRAEDIIPKWYKEGYRADASTVGPLRTGLDDKLLDTTLKYQPAKMVYVSCNTATSARGLVRLSKVYDAHYIQSVDMFPHTARTEAVVKLVRKWFLFWAKT